jgi:hypothetical protein
MDAVVTASLGHFLTVEDVGTFGIDGSATPQKQTGR